MSLDGRPVISIGEMAKKSGVSASALRGYEQMGLFRDAGIIVIRHGNFRYYDPNDSWKISQIKINRMTRRNQILVRQNEINASF